MARILLADDEAATRDLVRRALETDGHSVEVTESGIDALVVLGATPRQFDLLVTDVNMPGMDGLELSAKARLLNSDIGIVLMSGLVEHLERAKGMTSNRFSTIAKPFTLEQMRSLVRSVLVS